jgi:hypothetical protein
MLPAAISKGAAVRDWTLEDKETWKKAVKRVVTTPPCCGACSILSIEEGRKAYRYITGEDQSKDAEKIYQDHEKKLLDAFHTFNPSRYAYWFGNSLNGEKKP